MRDIMRGFIAVALFSLLAFNAVAAGPPPPPPSGPCCWPPIPAAKTVIDWWTFDEGSGTTSADMAGSVNNVGIDHGVIPRVSGVSYRAIELQGTQWVEVADGNEVDFLGSCSTNDAQSGTIAFWVATTQNTGVVTLLDKRESSTNFLRGYSLFLYNGRIGFQMATGAGNMSCNSAGSSCSNYVGTSIQSVATNAWHFVAVSFSRCNTPTGFLYVDGQTSSFTPRVGDMLNASNLYVGRTVPAMSGTPFHGWIDDLMIFKSAYTKAEIDALRADKCHANCLR